MLFNLQAKKNKKNLGDWSEDEDAAGAKETGAASLPCLNTWTSMLWNNKVGLIPFFASTCEYGSFIQTKD